MRLDDAWKLTLAFTSTFFLNAIATLVLHVRNPRHHVQVITVMLITATLTASLALLLLLTKLRDPCLRILHRHYVDVELGNENLRASVVSHSEATRRGFVSVADEHPAVSADTSAALRLEVQRGGGNYDEEEAYVCYEDAYVMSDQIRPSDNARSRRAADTTYAAPSAESGVSSCEIEMKT